MENTRIEFQDIRTGTLDGWIEYEDGEFYASSEEYMSLVRFYKEGGATDEHTVGILSILNNGVLKGSVVNNN